MPINGEFINIQWYIYTMEFYSAIKKKQLIQQQDESQNNSSE